MFWTFLTIYAVGLFLSAMVRGWYLARRGIDDVNSNSGQRALPIQFLFIWPFIAMIAVPWIFITIGAVLGNKMSKLRKKS